MPLFESSSGVTINGGHFIDVAGDMNVHPEPMGQPLTALEFGWIETKRQLSGPQSNGWNIGAGNGGVLPNLLTFHVSNAVPDIVSTSTEPESLPIDLPGEFELTSQEINSLSFPDGEGGSWCPQNALALPNPVPSQLGVEISGSQNSPMYPPNSYLGPSNSDISCRSEPDQLFSGIHPPRQDSESNILPKESNVALSQQPVFPWDRPQDEQTNISITGGTFIGGNVNYIQREVALRILH